MSRHRNIKNIHEDDLYSPSPGSPSSFGQTPPSTLAGSWTKQYLLTDDGNGWMDNEGYSEQELSKEELDEAISCFRLDYGDVIPSDVLEFVIRRNSGNTMLAWEDYHQNTKEILDEVRKKNEEAFPEIKGITISHKPKGRGGRRKKNKSKPKPKKQQVKSTVSTDKVSNDALEAMKERTKKFDVVPPSELKEEINKRKLEVKDKPSRIFGKSKNVGKYQQQYMKTTNDDLKHETKSDFDFSTPSPDDIVESNNAPTQKVLSHDSELSKNFVPIQKKSSEKPKSSTPVKDELTPSALTKTLKQYKKPKMMKDSEKERMNICIIGHVDAGKSSLMGHLLYKTGEVSDKVIHRFKRDSEQAGKSSFHFAWVLDEHAEERERGVTIDVGVRHFETPLKLITILDSPGHRDFIPNMICGTASADAAILVVDSRPGEFEKGFQNGGQTKEHLILARSLGITQVCVAINKLDHCQFSKGRYDEIRNSIGNFMKISGFNLSDVSFVPCSALEGDNLVTKSDNIPWYKGDSIIGCIDKFQSATRRSDLPLRLSISDVYKTLHSGLTISGKLESGHINVGETCLIMPLQETCVVKQILRSKKLIKAAFAGDNVELSIQFGDASHLKHGQILCEPDNPVSYCTKFKAQIVTFDPEIPITKGTQVVLHHLNTEIPAVVTRLYHTLSKDGSIKHKKPRSIFGNVNAVIQITTSSAIPVEMYADNKAFGRVLLRQKGATIATGICLSKRKMSP